MTRRIGMLCGLVGVLVGSASAVQGGYLTVYGGPTYDPATGNGFAMPSRAFVNDSGTAVGFGKKYEAGVDKGYRAVRWDVSGAVELGNLGADGDGHADVEVVGINGVGVAVGTAPKYVAGAYLGYRAVRWDVSGTAPTELGNLGADGSGYTEMAAYSINDGGVVVGWGDSCAGGVSQGKCAVRWDASGAAGELESLDAISIAYDQALAVNDAGTAVGWAEKRVGGTWVQRAVRWDAAGGAVTELGNITTLSGWQTSVEACAVNSTGTAVGWADVFDEFGAYMGRRAIRWDASGTAATELGNLGTTGDGRTEVVAEGINDAGVAVGTARKYEGGVDKDSRAVRWDPSTAEATELGLLGIGSYGETWSSAAAINATGVIVGSALAPEGLLTEHAVYWGDDGAAVDLNSLIDPGDGWVLEYAYSISDTGWVAGVGVFDPDGPGGSGDYERYFMLQIPEPAGMSLMAWGAAVLLRKRRCRSVRC